MGFWKTRSVAFIGALALTIVGTGAFGFLAHAVDFTSTNFILRDPVITIEGGRSTSTSFEYFSSSGQTVTGENTSASFIERSGFLYFPVATSPVVTATAGNGQVSLTWTASVGTLANITTYEVGTATVSGGPYAFDSVGDVLLFTKTGLTNGTSHFFIVRAFAGTLRLAQSAEVSSTPTAPPPSGGGGGGGAPAPPLSATVNFSGRAYPSRTVTLLKDAQITSTTIAGSDAIFQTSVTGLSAGNYIFSLYAEDRDGRRSSLLTFPVSVTAGATTNVSGIFIAPTIDVDKSEVRRGESIAIFGQSSPQADMLIQVSSHQDFFANTVSDKDGIYLYQFDTSVLEFGSHTTKSKASIGNQLISSFGRVVGFRVGDKTVIKTRVVVLKGDLNKDGRVNLIDFSIAAFWYQRTISVSFQAIEVERLNGDGKVDLVDFSIMAFFWTG